MKKILSCLLAACLVISSVDVPVNAEEVIDGEIYYSIEEATNIIDNLIIEGEGIDESHFAYQYLKDNPLCDANLWIKKINYLRIRIHTDKNQSETYYGGEGYGRVIYNQNETQYYVEVKYSLNLSGGKYDKQRYLAGLYYYKIIFSYGFEKLPITYLYNMLKNIKEHNSLESFIWQKLMGYTIIPDTYITNTFNEYLYDYRCVSCYEDDSSWCDGFSRNDLNKLKSLLLESFEIMLQEAEEPYIDTSPTAGVDISNMINAMKKAADTKKINSTKKSGTNGSTSTNTSSKTNNITVKSLTKVTKVKLSAKKKQITIKWDKVANAKKYEIQIARNKKFKNATGIRTKKNSKTIKKLKSNKKYYIRIRAINGKVKSKWVKKNIKTK